MKVYQIATVHYHEIRLEKDGLNHSLSHTAKLTIQEGVYATWEQAVKAVKASGDNYDCIGTVIYHGDSLSVWQDYTAVVWGANDYKIILETEVASQSEANS